MRLVAMVVLVLGACATTPYQRKGAGAQSGGYNETETSSGTYLVTFAGNGHTDLDDQQFVMRRAAELCPDGFEVLDRDSAVTPTRTVVVVGDGVVTAHKNARPSASAMIRCEEH